MGKYSGESWISKPLMSCSINPHVISVYFPNTGQRPAQWGWQERSQTVNELPLLCMVRYHQLYLPHWSSMSRPIKTFSNNWLHYNLFKWWICILKFKNKSTYGMLQIFPDKIPEKPKSVGQKHSLESWKTHTHRACVLTKIIKGPNVTAVKLKTLTSLGKLVDVILKCNIISELQITGVYVNWVKKKKIPLAVMLDLRVKILSKLLK